MYNTFFRRACLPSRSHFLWLCFQYLLLFQRAAYVLMLLMRQQISSRRPIQAPTGVFPLSKLEGLSLLVLLMQQRFCSRRPIQAPTGVFPPNKSAGLSARSCVVDQTVSPKSSNSKYNFEIRNTKKYFQKTTVDLLLAIITFMASRNFMPVILVCACHVLAFAFCLIIVPAPRGLCRRSPL